MSESEANPVLHVEQTVDDVTAEEGKEDTAVANLADNSAIKPDISNSEPSSELEQKIIKQIEVSNHSLVMLTQLCLKRTRHLRSMSCFCLRYRVNHNSTVHSSITAYKNINKKFSLLLT